MMSYLLTDPTQKGQLGIESRPKSCQTQLETAAVKEVQQSKNIHPKST